MDDVETQPPIDSRRRVGFAGLCKEDPAGVVLVLAAAVAYDRRCRVRRANGIALVNPCVTARRAPRREQGCPGNGTDRPE